MGQETVTLDEAWSVLSGAITGVVQHLDARDVRDLLRELVDSDEIWAAIPILAAHVGPLCDDALNQARIELAVVGAGRSRNSA
jgi:hypothetical protein